MKRALVCLASATSALLAAGCCNKAPLGTGLGANVPGQACAPAGTGCRSDAECCEGTCSGADGGVCCPELGSGCGGGCGSGESCVCGGCCPGIGSACVPDAGACCAGLDCEGLAVDGGRADRCCAREGLACAGDADCCSGLCEGGQCVCAGSDAGCAASADCCSGNCGAAGRCD